MKSEEQTNLTVLEGRFDWRQIVGVRNMLFGVSLMEVVWFVVYFWFVVWWLVWARNGIREKTGAPNDGFLPNAIKICFRLSGVLLKLCIYFLSSAIKFISVRPS